MQSTLYAATPSDVEGVIYGRPGAPTHVAVDVIGGRPYALVTTENVAQVLVIDITDPYNTLATARVKHTDSDGKSILPSSPKSIATASIGDWTFALVAGHVSEDAGINILNIVNPASPIPFGPLPVIALNTSPPRYAIWSGSGTDELTQMSFKYRVAEGDVSDDLGYVSTIAFDLNGNSMTDADGDGIDAPSLPDPGTSNSLSGGADIVIDPMAPAILSANATSLTSITVVLSESVSGGTADGAGWSISGADAGSIHVSASTVPAWTDTITLTLSDSLPDTSPDIDVTYMAQEDGIVDDVSNPLNATAPVDDGITPLILSTDVVSEHALAIVFSEPVTGRSLGLSISNTTNQITIPSSTISGADITLRLHGDIIGSDKPRLLYDPDLGNIVDGAQHKLLRANMTATTSGIDNDPPVIVNATVIGTVSLIASTIKVIFNENVDANPRGIEPWSVRGQDVQQGTTVDIVTDPAGVSDEVTLRLSRHLKGPSPTAELIYTAPVAGGPGTILDGAANALMTQQVTILDGVEPFYTGADAVSPLTVQVMFAENVTGGHAGFSVTGTLNSIEVMGATISGGNVTLDLSEPILGPDTPFLLYNGARGNIADISGNELTTFTTPRQIMKSGIDTIPPTISSVMSSTLDTITVQFDEPVYGTTDTAPWRISGADRGPIASVSDPAGTDTITITLSEEQEDTFPNMVLSYLSQNGTITDGSSNPLGDHSQHVRDDLRPKVKTVSALSPNQIVITFTEGVTGDSNGFTVSDTATDTTVQQTTFSASGQNPNVRLHLIGGILVTDSPQIGYTKPGNGSVRDGAGNEMSNFEDLQIMTSDMDSTPPRMTGAVATERDRIIVSISEDVSVNSTADPTAWILSGDDSGTLRVLEVLARNLFESITLELDGELPDTVPNLSLGYTGGDDIVDSVGNPLTIGTVPVEDGVPPELASISILSATEISLNFTEHVSGTTNGFSIGGLSTQIDALIMEVAGDSITLTLSDTIIGPTLPRLSYDSEIGDLTDASSNPSC